MSERLSNKYSDNLETLVALVTHLAMTQYKSRTASVLATDLSLDRDHVLHVLQTFKGLFRPSQNLYRPDKGDPEPYYWLQLRYARWYLEDKKEDAGKVEPPLEADYLTALLDFIMKMVDQEKTEKRQLSSNAVAIVASIIALIASVVAAIIALKVK